MSFYVPDEEIAARVKLFDEIARALIDSGILPDEEIVYRSKHLPLLVNGYFLLNRAYKRWRIAPNHYTQEPKIAALFCMSVATFQPFIAIDPQNATTVAQARANEIYAIACASVIIGIPIDPASGVKRDFWLRLLDILSRARSETLEPYIKDIFYEINRPLDEYELSITDSSDVLMIDCLITIFEAISGLPTPSGKET